MRRVERVSVCVVGAGAAGLMTGITAAQAIDSSMPVAVVDGAKKVGAKILVAGGGRCNVTHHRVRVDDYCGSSADSIKRVLRAFPVARTKRFFAERGVELKQEDTGKLFPTTDSARTVLNALLTSLQHEGATLWNPWRCHSISRLPDNTFSVLTQQSEIESAFPHEIITERVVLSTGGKALPRTGSDGFGYELARSLGHSITERVFPALVPLKTSPEQPLSLHALSGLSTDATLHVCDPSGKRLASMTGSTLCTHFGLSGPAPMNVSRHILDAWHDHPDARVTVNWLKDMSFDEADRRLLELGGATPISLLRAYMPERLGRAICDSAGVEPNAPAHTLSRAARRLLAGQLTECDVNVSGDRGYAQAEATAGGVPLSELDVRTMESRITPGLFIAGELCDVDGRIGGFNFQWAWASGYVAGKAIAASLTDTTCM